MSGRVTEPDQSRSSNVIAFIYFSSSDVSLYPGILVQLLVCFYLHCFPLLLLIAKETGGIFKLVGLLLSLKRLFTNIEATIVAECICDR